MQKQREGATALRGLIQLHLQRRHLAGKTPPALTLGLCCILSLLTRKVSVFVVCQPSFLLVLTWHVV